MHHLHETLTGGFYYLKNISKTIWILVMSFEKVPAPFQTRERNTTDPFHVTRVVHVPVVVAVAVVAVAVVLVAVLVV